MYSSHSTQIFAAVLLLATSAMAATQTVMVGQGGLKYSPSNITAAVGDVIQFQFVGGNHSFTQSTFAAPCTPAGIDSGFMEGSAASPPTFSLLVNDTKPFWAYCAQGHHCQAGMVFSINADEASDKSFAAFQGAAATATSGAYPGTGASAASGSGTASVASSSASAAASAASSSMASGSPKASSAAASASGAAASAKPSGAATRSVVTGASAIAGLLMASFGVLL